MPKLKLESFEILHCNAGWRDFSFLELQAVGGQTGIAEFNECYGSPGLSAVIARLARALEGRDVSSLERVESELYARTRQAAGGMTAQAIAAIMNALTDMRARSLGIPVYELLGGPVRDRLRLYWSHLGSYRIGNAARHLDVSPLTGLDDVTALGREVRSKGFTAAKTNIFVFDDGDPRMHMPGFAATEGGPSLNADRPLLNALEAQMTALREGLGPDIDLMLDLNFNFRTEGYLRVTRLLDSHGLFWFEIDSYDPAALRDIRRSLRTPIASCESLCGMRQFLPFFERRSMDVAIVDVPWNGIWQSMKVAALADAFEMNIAPHNFYGHLSTMMSAHFCAAVPNFRIMEIDIDDVPWKDEIVTPAPTILNGHMVLSGAPGWGVSLDREAIARHPPKWAGQ